MFPAKPIIMAFAACALLIGCGRPAQPVAEKSAARAPDAYLAPPGVTAAVRVGSTLRLSGEAPPGSRVRLASPAGEASFTAADRAGRWTLPLAAGLAPRILGLSATAGGRQVQAQGYILVTPTGQVALLRSGAGAVRVDRLPAVAIGAVDFDGQGGAVVSGQAPANAPVAVRLDGGQAADGRADAVGRFSISLPQPVAAGEHGLEIAGDGFSARTSVAVSAAAPLTAGPFRSAPAGAGVRADWMTPGGGVQTTVIIG